MSDVVKSEPTDEDARLYLKVLEEVNVRLHYAAGALQKSRTHPRLEVVALHLRMMIELIIMGALVTNRDLVEAEAPAFATKGPDAVKKLLDRVNPDHWPQPVEVDDSAGRYELVEIDSPYLRREQALRKWGDVSNLLHADNPYKRTPFLPRPDLDERWEQLRELHGLVATLMRHHVLLTVDELYMIEAWVPGRKDDPPRIKTTMLEAWRTQPPDESGN